MKPRAKRFQKKFGGIADAVASLDLDQIDREAVAVAIGDAFGERRDPDFDRNLFVLLASDPLVPCAGPGDGEACPDGRVIRIGMHLSSEEEPLPRGRSLAWRRRAPYGKVRCVSCGSRRYAARFASGPYEEVR